MAVGFARHPHRHRKSRRMPPASVLWVMSGECTFMTSGYPVCPADPQRLVPRIVAISVLITGSPYAMSISLESDSGMNPLDGRTRRPAFGLFPDRTPGAPAQFRRNFQQYFKISGIFNHIKKSSDRPFRRLIRREFPLHLGSSTAFPMRLPPIKQVNTGYWRSFISGRPASRPRKVGR